jgi:hypothetical protein
LIEIDLKLSFHFKLSFFYNLCDLFYFQRLLQFDYDWSGEFGTEPVKKAKKQGNKFVAIASAFDNAAAANKASRVGRVESTKKLYKPKLARKPPVVQFDMNGRRIKTVQETEESLKVETVTSDVAPTVEEIVEKPVQDVDESRLDQL